ncbi:MAG TPA: hypothetical protein VIJ57_13720 [Hanamia sp.]
MKKFIPFQFGISSQPLKPFDADEKKARKLEKLLRLDTSDVMVKICNHYVSNTEFKYYIVQTIFCRYNTI